MAQEDDEIFKVTLQLSNCTASNTAETTGSPYQNVLTPTNGQTFSDPNFHIYIYLCPRSYSSDQIPDWQADCTNVIESAFNAETGEINIPEVTGDVKIAVEYSNK